MAKVGGRQLTLGACGLTKFAETADGRQVQLHIPKYVQGPVGLPWDPDGYGLVGDLLGSLPWGLGPGGLRRATPRAFAQCRLATSSLSRKMATECPHQQGIQSKELA